MSTTKHTPLLPLQIRETPTGTVDICEANGAVLAVCAAEDAQFIVRACNAHHDLLAYLEQIASYPTRHNMTDGGDRAHQEMAHLAANAIAKAKGQP